MNINKTITAKGTNMKRSVTLLVLLLADVWAGYAWGAGQAPPSARTVHADLSGVVGGQPERHVPTR